MLKQLTMAQVPVHKYEQFQNLAEQAALQLEGRSRHAHLLLCGRHMEDTVVPQLVQGPPSLGLRFSFWRLGGHWEA
jgi:hypothetical protein